MGISNPGGGSSQWTLIDDIDLAADDNFDVTIPGDFSHLYIVLVARATSATTNKQVFMILNSDTTQANYRIAEHRGGTGHTSVAGDAIRIATIPGTSSPANTFGHARVWIPFYASTDHHHPYDAINLERRSAAEVNSYINALFWENTAAITQVTIQPSDYPTTKFLATSKAQFWGLG